MPAVPADRDHVTIAKGPAGHCGAAAQAVGRVPKPTQGYDVRAAPTPKPKLGQLLHLWRFCCDDGAARTRGAHVDRSIFKPVQGGGGRQLSCSPPPRRPLGLQAMPKVPHRRHVRKALGSHVQRARRPLHCVRKPFIDLPSKRAPRRRPEPAAKDKVIRLN